MFVDLLLTNPEQRQLKLLSVIRMEQRIEFTELSKILGWPYVSTQQVYRRVIANYQTISGEKVTKAKLVAECDWIDLQLTHYLIQHSAGYQCLMAAIHNQPKPVLSLGAQTVQNRLKPLVGWLQAHRLVYDSQTNVLTGDERLIRLFGWQLAELGGEPIELQDSEVDYFVALAKILPTKTKQTDQLNEFLKVTAIRLAQLNTLTQESESAPSSKQNELLRRVRLPEQARGMQFNLGEVYWLQYMVTYSPYFVDTRRTKIVRPKERAVLPYLIQLIVKATVTRLRIYRSPLYFEQLDEYLMECVQFALLLKQPVMHLNQATDISPLPQLQKVVSRLLADIPELRGSSELISTVLTVECARFLPKQRVDVGYPELFDDYLVGVLQQQLMTKFMSVDWHLDSLPVTTEVTTPTFRIVIQPTQPATDQYYWLPWLSISTNIQFLLQKIQVWLSETVWGTPTTVPVVINEA